LRENKEKEREVRCDAIRRTMNGVEPVKKKERKEKKWETKKNR
jgi:hypothetical protein